MRWLLTAYFYRQGFRYRAACEAAAEAEADWKMEQSRTQLENET
jgi:hypothetical protein